MDEATIQDLKQFIATTISQQITEVTQRLDSVEHKVDGVTQRLDSVEHKIDNLSESVGEAIENTNVAIDSQLKDHEQRITHLEHKPV